MPKAEGTTFTHVELRECPSCRSTLGPFKDRVQELNQIICSTCGCRGPYPTQFKTAEEGWNDMPRVRYE